MTTESFMLPQEARGTEAEERTRGRERREQNKRSGRSYRKVCECRMEGAKG